MSILSPLSKDKKRAKVNQTNTGTVSQASLGKILRDGVGRGGGGSNDGLS